jgi:ABC-type lipoprotein export system ATPase subunit
MVHHAETESRKRQVIRNETTENRLRTKAKIQRNRRQIDFLLSPNAALPHPQGMSMPAPARALAPVFRLEQVSKSFAAGERTGSVAVLQDLTLEIEAGESVAIIGPSGSGKSTLLNIIGTLDQPSSGRVWLAGQDLSTLKEAELAAVRNRQLGFIFQAHHLLPQCTVLENVLVPTLATGRSREDQRKEATHRATQLLQRVGLGERLSHRPGELSGGERQRTAVVRALINRPKLLLADEPTGALDRAAAHELAQLLLELNREEQVTLIVVTHAQDLARQMRRVLELRDGRLQAHPSGNR